jgi:hypothetical protein
VSRSLLESKLCSLPEENKLWQEVNLEPNPFRWFLPSGIAYHFIIVRNIYLQVKK